MVRSRSSNGARHPLAAEASVLRKADAGGLRTGSGFPSQETGIARVSLGLFVAFGSNPRARE